MLPVEVVPLPVALLPVGDLRQLPDASAEGQLERADDLVPDHEAQGNVVEVLRYALLPQQLLRGDRPALADEAHAVDARRSVRDVEIVPDRPLRPARDRALILLGALDVDPAPAADQVRPEPRGASYIASPAERRARPAAAHRPFGTPDDTARAVSVLAARFAEPHAVRDAADVRSARDAARALLLCRGRAVALAGTDGGKEDVLGIGYQEAGQIQSVLHVEIQLKADGADDAARMVFRVDRALVHAAVDGGDIVLIGLVRGEIDGLAAHVPHIVRSARELVEHIPHLSGDRRQILADDARRAARFRHHRGGFRAQVVERLVHFRHIGLVKPRPVDHDLPRLGVIMDAVPFGHTLAVHALHQVFQGGVGGVALDLHPGDLVGHAVAEGGRVPGRIVEQPLQREQALLHLVELSLGQIPL